MIFDGNKVKNDMITFITISSIQFIAMLTEEKLEIEVVKMFWKIYKIIQAIYT